MIDEQAKALGLRVTTWMSKRGIAKPRWPDGVLYTDEIEGKYRDGGTVLPEDWPDLRDPATFGALQGVLEDALGHRVCFVKAPHGWGCGPADVRSDDPGVHDCPTREHALVAALEMLTKETARRPTP